MNIYCFWNNKGGTGKTSLAFQTICRFAAKNIDKRILAIDVCPQANLSELLLGGLTNNGSDNLLKCQGSQLRSTVGGYFQLRLPSPFTMIEIDPNDFLTFPKEHNNQIPKNIDLLCGDPLLELQSNAISTLANTQIPGTNTWLSIIDWLKDFLGPLTNKYDTVFIDTNPSFSIYTQIALSAADKLMLPVMADDSSRRAIQNAFSLIYGLKLPSKIYAQHAFATKLKDQERPLPKVHLVIKNRITQYMGPASAYSAVLCSIEKDIEILLASHPDIFTFENISSGIVDVRDFQTTGVVASARGCPFFSLRSGRLDVAGRRIQINDDYRQKCIKSIDRIVDTL